MKLPKKVKIMNRSYKVVRGQEIITQDNEKCWGLIDYDGVVVAIKNRDNSCFQEEKEAETFMHEILHGIDESAVLKLKEHQVRTLAIHLLTVIRDNKIDFLSYD